MSETLAPPSGPLTRTNAEIADQLLGTAQLLSAQGENPFKIRAYRRAAETVRSLPESVEERVRTGADLTGYAGIGKGIASAIRELVLAGTTRKLEVLRATVSPELAALSRFPRLDPKRTLRIYQKLGISDVDALRAKLEAGEIGRVLGTRMEQHVRQALVESDEALLYDVDALTSGLLKFLKKGGARRAEIAGEVRRRQEIVREITVLVETNDFGALVEAATRFGGSTATIETGDHRAVLRLPSGLRLKLERAMAATWGLGQVLATGSVGHLEKLEETAGGLAALTGGRVRLTNERAVYRRLELAYIEPELREGGDEVERAARGALPRLVAAPDIRGDLHCHSTASDGAHSIEEMAKAARERGYSYLGITDHSKSLRIANGVSEEDLWRQIRRIDALNGKLRGFRILKGAEVDILADGTLDYSDALLAELDYTVCSIHSRFGLGRQQQTERILRAMDNPHFCILGHATGRLLLRRPGYELDMERLIQHARAAGCCFEINSSPDRLDLSATHARRARDGGVKIAINTDAHSVAELDFLRCGIDQARRAGLAREDVLNTHAWTALRKQLRRR